MECSIKKDIIEPILNTIQPFSNKKDSTQINSHVLIEIKDKKLACYATDFDIGLRMTTEEITIIKPGRITANIKKLLDIIRNLKNNNPIKLKADNNHLNISQDKSKFKLPSFIAEEFPTFPEYDDATAMDIKFHSLSHYFKKIIPVIDTNNQRVEITGMLISLGKEKFDIVGTDTKRLAIITQPATDIQTTFIIPKQAISEIQKLNFEQDTTVFQTPSMLILKDSKSQCFMRLINGIYPQYEKIIPTNFSHNISIPRDIFLEAIKLIETLSNEIRLDIKENEIIFSSLNHGTDETAETSIELTDRVETPISIAIHSRQIIDFLAHTQTQNFFLKIKEANSPFVLESENFITVIIPITI